MFKKLKQPGRVVDTQTTNILVVEGGRNGEERNQGMKFQYEIYNNNNNNIINKQASCLFKKRTIEQL